MDVEGELIARALDDPAAMSLAMERRVTVEFFSDAQHHKVWEYVLQHFREYGVAPDTDVVKGAYPSYDIAVPRQPVEFYLDELARRRSKAILLDGVKQMLAANEEEGPGSQAKMRDLLRQAIEQSDSETLAAGHDDYPDTMDQSWKQHRVGTTLGLSYGFPTLDRVTNGIQPQQFVVFTGLPKTRKSWTLLHVASSVHAQGVSVAFLTFEMSNKEQKERLYTLWGKVPYYVVRDPSLITDDHEKSLMRMLHVRQQLRLFRGVEDTYGHSTVGSLMAFIKEMGAEVVFIDGLYLMTDERTGQAGFEGHSSLTNISRDLKKMAKTLGVAVVSTTQTLHSKIKQNRTNLGGMGYTSAFAQDADVIVGVEVEEDPKMTTMRVLGNRTGPQGIEFQVEWDLDNGLIEEIGEDLNTTGAIHVNP